MSRHGHMKSQFDPEIVERLRVGDEHAFEQVYDEHHKPLYFVALRYLKDPDLASDVLQEVFIKLWTHRETLDSSQKLKGFLYITLKNRVLNTIRNKRSVILKHIEISSQQKRSSNDLEDKLYRQVCEDGFYAAVAELPRRRRLIFKLKVFKGLDNQAVAKKLGISVNTVKVQYQIATRQVRKNLKDLT